MQKKAIYAITLAVIILVVAVAAYWFYSSSSSTPTEVFKVAMIHTGSFQNEYGLWNYNAGQKLDALPDVEVDFSGDVPVADFERVAGEYVDDGYKLILGITADYMGQLNATSAKYNNTYFATSSGWIFKKNLGSYTTWPHEAFYLEGLLGAMLSNTSKIGYVCGFPYPLPLACVNGLIQGAQSVNPNITIVSASAATWVDIAKGYEIGKSMTDSGVDFITISADGVGLGVLQAAKDARVYSCGIFVDMVNHAPNSIVTSVLFDPYPLYVQMIDDIKAGNGIGKNYNGNMLDGCISLTDFHQNIPQAVKDAFNTAKQKILNGTLSVQLKTDAELPHN